MIRVRASQIFTHSKEDVVAAKKMLDSGSPFEEIVTRYSTCPSKENAGDLGWMPEDNRDPGGGFWLHIAITLLRGHGYFLLVSNGKPL